MLSYISHGSISCLKWEEVERSADHSNQDKDIFEDKDNQVKVEDTDNQIKVEDTVNQNKAVEDNINRVKTQLITVYSVQSEQAQRTVREYNNNSVQ